MLAALSGCQKEEVAPAGNEKAIASFYEANTSNTIVQKLAKNLSEQPDAQKRAQVLYQTYGKPLWNKAKIVANTHSLQVLVPMEEVGYKHLTAIWGFDVKEDVISYNFLENEQSSPLYPKLGWLFPAMEQEIYNASPNGKRYVRQGHLKTNVIMQMTCYEVWVDYGKGSEYSYTNCYSSGVWIYDTPSGNGGTIPQTPSDYVPPHGNGNSNPTLPDRDPDPKVDPFCNSNDAINDETELISCNSSPEPKWGQLGNLSDINAEFNKVRSRNLSFDKLNLGNQLELLQKHFEGNRSFTRDSNGNIVDDITREGYANVDRYIYTNDGGWIDLNHFFMTAALAEKTCLRTAIAYTNLGELIQDMKGSPSAYSYEDLPSNRFGAEFWLQYNKNLK